jgi:transposase
MKQRRNHTPEFKLKLVQQLLSGEKRPAQLCREHNLSETSLMKWRRAYAERGEDAFKNESDDLETQCRERHLERRVAELERLVGQLTFENNVLKTVSETYRKNGGSR